MTTQSEILWKYNLNIEQIAPTELLNKYPINATNSKPLRGN